MSDEAKKLAEDYASGILEKALSEAKGVPPALMEEYRKQVLATAGPPLVNAFLAGWSARGEADNVICPECGFTVNCHHVTCKAGVPK